jgi:hypothetical protein
MFQRTWAKLSAADVVDDGPREEGLPFSAKSGLLPLDAAMTPDGLLVSKLAVATAGLGDELS